MTKKLRGDSGKNSAQKSRNSWGVNGRSCGCIGTIDLGPKCAQFYDQIQTLKYLFCCHLYCVHVCKHVYRTVVASLVVSNRESRFPQSQFGFLQGSWKNLKMNPFWFGGLVRLRGLGIFLHIPNSQNISNIRKKVILGVKSLSSLVRILR